MKNLQGYFDTLLEEMSSPEVFYLQIHIKFIPAVNLKVTMNFPNEVPRFKPLPSEPHGNNCHAWYA